MKKQISVLIIFISVLFFMIACDDNKKEEVNDSDTEETPDDEGDCPVTVPVEHDGEEITAATDWSGIHHIIGTLWVKAPLTMDKCTTILMDPNSRISVSDGGSIKVNGTADNIVPFLSAKAVPAAGDWNGIEIKKTASSGNSFKFTSFSHAGKSSYGAIWVDGEAEVAIDDCAFISIDNYGVMFENGAKIESFTGNKFASIGTYPVLVGANAVPALSPVETDDATDRIFVQAEDVEDAGTWKNLSIGYEVEYLFIHKPVTIEQGNTLFMRENAHVDLADGGSMIAVGTEIAPIVFTSAKEGPGAGDWKQITVRDTASNDTKFEYVNFEFGGGDDYGVIWVDPEAAVSIDNCKFSDIQGTGLIFDNGAEIGSFTNNEFVNIETYPVTIGANAVPALSPIVTDDTTDRIYVKAEDIDDAGTWKNLSIGYEIEYLYLHKPIIIEAGTTLFMRENGQINTENGGALTLDGTETAHVTITSYKDAPAEGDWKQIEIYDSGSDANVFNYADIMYGGSDDYGQLWVQSGAKITLNNVVFSNGQTCDLFNENGEALITDTGSTYVTCPE
ncbi:MAG TPA: hypothetical protein P5044_05110 [bacterium]|nr:hypothetical protein [bacterium]